MGLINHIKKTRNPLKYWSKKGVKFGKNCIVAPTAFFDTEPYLIEIGNNVHISSFARFVTHDGGVHVFRQLSEEDKNLDLFKGRISVGDNSFIGNYVAIMPGVKIGKNCIIGYGSIVSKDIPDNSVACGIPAKVIETIEEYRAKNEKYFVKTKNLDDEAKKKFLEEKFK